MTCSATGNPIPEISWSFDGQIPIESNQIESTPGISTLTISKVTVGHAGAYTCHVRNKQGEETRVTNVRVETPPIIQARVNTTLTAKIGENVTFDCHAEGDPQPSYTWAHNSIAVKPSRLVV